MYYINEWAIVRRNEMVPLPDKIEIHPDFLKELSHIEFEKTFREIWELFRKIYEDISLAPEKFSMPLYSPDEYRYGSTEANNSRNAPWIPIKLLYYTAICGNMRDNRLIIDLIRFKEINTVKNIKKLHTALSEYGFIFNDFEIYYPNNPNILHVMSLVAKKAADVNRGADNHNFLNDFYAWNYRILKDDFNTVSHGDIVHYLADKMQDDDYNFVMKFHKIMTDKEYLCRKGGGNEGPGIKYYINELLMRKNGPYLYCLLSWKSKLYLYLRIRNAENCVSYVENEAPETIKEIFRVNESGCGNRQNCKSGVKYMYEGTERWHCGCCSAAFKIEPNIDDIPYYIKLVELGAKK